MIPVDVDMLMLLMLSSSEILGIKNRNNFLVRQDLCLEDERKIFSQFMRAEADGVYMILRDGMFYKFD